MIYHHNVGSSQEVAFAPWWDPSARFGAHAEQYFTLL
jgi:hypothetical protein